MRRVTVALVLLASLMSAPVWAGGAWVPKPGDGSFQLGASRKRAHSSWGRRGQTLANQGDHDFRYAYLSGEAGVWRGLAANWTITYLDGFEGRPNALEENAGLSDAWLGLKYGFNQETGWPLAVGLTYRTPVFYDQKGVYDRHTFDTQGHVTGLNSEWRGILKHDYSLTFLASHSLWEGKGWANVETGYTWREGAPADQVPLYADVGLPLPWYGLRAKVAGVFIQSVGNNTPRHHNDRFGSSATNNFNNASMARLGTSLMVPLGRDRGWYLEAGYNQWLWGRSARKYQEPFLSFGHGF
ncbi:MAG TPA: TonB-dependent receptor [Thermoanaerobaculia bacterium]|jgi:hypothetical protein|nr:TonB-dependent receptor [Thermoanaerobaculia bacterium]